MNPAAAVDGAWSSGLFDCFDDCGLWCLTVWCPCVTFGRVAAIVDKDVKSSSKGRTMYLSLALFTGCPWIYSCVIRGKLRAKYALPEAPCCDCCVHFCCETCVLVQEYKELKARGHFPVLGGGSAPGVQRMGR